MKFKGIAFFSIVVLAFALMALIVITQYFTNKSTKALNIGNRQAVETYRINNGIQELVNLSFDLQSKLKDPGLALHGSTIKQLQDSITMLGYNANILTIKESHPLSATINGIIDTQINISQNILNALTQNNIVQKKKWADSLQHFNPGDKVYTSCVSLEKLLKNNLQQTLTKNSEQAGKLSMYSRILAILAIIAILVMTTIIIRRQAQQLELIEDLRFAKMAALKSKNAKDEFLANMSHELRTPLTALIGFGNLLHETKLNGDQKEYVEMIRSGGYNLLNIVNDVLDLSKIEAGKLTIAHRPFNIYDLFSKIEKLFFNSLQQKGLTCSYHLDELIPANMIGDPDRLQQIFVNLISNAIKFTNEGGITINAGIVWIDEEKKFYKLSFAVRDTGTGIPKDKIATIFERFEQLEHGTQRQHGGTGLGLTIVKNLVEKMGGAISVYSRVNEGSEFNFTCILERSATAVNEKNTPLISKLSFVNCNVLIVEDNRANQILLKHIFGKFNIQPKMLDNGAEAVEILKTEQFDLIFMDIQMPVMDGYTAIGMIHNQLHVTSPVIAMTAYVTEMEIEKCYKAGFNDYLHKPIDERTLIDKLSKYLKDKCREKQVKDDFKFLKEIIGDDPNTIQEILNEMKIQWEIDKKDLINATQEKDIKQLNYVLHRIRSTFSFLGPDHKIYKIVLEEGSSLTETNPAAIPEYHHFINKIDKEVDLSSKELFVEKANTIS
ncbi:MAG: ATP-binding protein [Niabella sp.]